MTYTPTPGTIPHKVIAHLKTLGPDIELSTIEIADALDIDKTLLAASLAPARQKGAVRSRIGTNRVAYWCLGDGTPLPRAEDYEPDKPLRTAPAPTPAVTSIAPHWLGALPPDLAAVMAPEKRVNTEAVRIPAPLTSAIHCDGRVVLRKAGATLEATPDEARQLYAHMHRFFRAD